MKPHLPRVSCALLKLSNHTFSHNFVNCSYMTCKLQYNIPEILKKIEKKGNDAVRESIQNLNENGILIGKERRLLIRILVRHLFFKIAK